MTSRSRAKISSHNLEPVRISVAEKILRCRGRQTPSNLYTALREFQKEQADAESMVSRAQHRKAVRAVPKQKWVTMQGRIQSAVANYSDYKDKDDMYTYLRTISYSIDAS